MSKNSLCLFVFSLLILSCNNDSDADNGCDIPLALVDCLSPISYSGVAFFFLDKDTNDNSFVSGSLTLEDIIVTNNHNNIVEKELKEIKVHSSDLPFSSHFLVIYDDFESGENNYNFKVKDNVDFDVIINVVFNTSGCCLGSYLENIQVQGIEHNLEHSIYLPIIYIDQ